jgi:hypothetical protein
MLVLIVSQLPPSKKTGPGDTMLTRMPLPASDWAMLFA